MTTRDCRAGVYLALARVFGRDCAFGLVLIPASYRRVRFCVPTHSAAPWRPLADGAAPHELSLRPCTARGIDALTPKRRVS